MDIQQGLYNPSIGGGTITNLTEVGGSPITLGQALMAASLPVVIASDQSALPISGSISFTAPQHVIVDSGSITFSNTTIAVTNTGTFAVQASQSTAANLNATVIQGTSPWVVSLTSTTITGTVAATQSGTWSTRTQDGSGTGITSTGSALDVNLKTSSITLPVSLTSTTITGTVAVTESGTWNVRNQDGAGNGLTTNSTTYSSKFALDGNLLGTLGTAFSTAGKVDIKGADGDVFVRQTTGTNLHVVTDATSVTSNTKVVSTVPTATTLQNAATGSGNGTNLSTAGYSTAILSITASVPMSGGTTINFEASTDNTTFVPLLGSSVGSNTLTTTTTGIGDFEFNVAGYSFLRARISAYNAGTITIKGYTIAEAGAPNVVNANIVANTVFTDNAVFTPGTTNVNPVAYEVDDINTGLATEGNAGIARMSQNRSQYAQIRDGKNLQEYGAAVTIDNLLSITNPEERSLLERILLQENDSYALQLSTYGSAQKNLALPITDLSQTPLAYDSTVIEQGHVIKTTGGVLHILFGYNGRTTSQFIHVYNATTLPVDGAIPVISFLVTGTSNFSYDFGKYSKAFPLGIVVGNSSTQATKTAGSADCWFNILYN